MKFLFSEMALTPAQKQKAYRERKKLSDPGYLAREKQRVMHYYTPANEMNARSLAVRNYKSVIRNRVSRLRKKEVQMESNLDIDSSIPGTSDTGNQKLMVRLPSVEKSRKKAAGLKKVKQRALAKSHKKIKTLETHLAVLLKRMKSKNRKIERLQAKMIQVGQVGTPKKKALADIQVLNLTTKQKLRMKKKILLGSALMEELKMSKEATTLKSRNPLYWFISGKITKKYWLLSTISKGTGFSRNSLIRVKSKKGSNLREVRKSLTKDVAEKVLAFMKREDNSRIQPGKADAKKTDGLKQQTIVLTDYLANLHAKFLAENNHIKVSLATFCRLRPKHILLAAFISRNACLCLRHQNMALKINAIRKLGININQNPDKLLPEMNRVETAARTTRECAVQKMEAIENFRRQQGSLQDQGDRANFCQG